MLSDGVVADLCIKNELLERGNGVTVLNSTPVTYAMPSLLSVSGFGLA